MGFTIQKLTNIYIISTLALFAYTCYDMYKQADNYFSAFLVYFDDSITNFLFYNTIFSIGILFYKSTIWLFFQEVKQNQTLKLVDKLKGKIIDVLLFCYIMDGQIEMNSFTCIVFIFFSYVIHCMAIFRSQYLIHSPGTLSLNLNYRLAALFLVLLFFDYQMLVYSYELIYSQNATHFIFAYYTITISLSLIQPLIKYFIDFYQKYTLCHIRNIDQNMALITLCVSIPRLLVQIVLSICLAMRFGIVFYLIFTVIQLISQLTTTVKSYQRIKKLTDTMKNLTKIDQEQIKKHHDNTCMVCFQDMTQATLLPCKHFFHDQCLRQWIIKNSNHFCPKCKKEFNFDTKKQIKLPQNLVAQDIINPPRRPYQSQAQRIVRQKRLKKFQGDKARQQQQKKKSQEKQSQEQKPKIVYRKMTKKQAQKLIKQHGQVILQKNRIKPREELSVQEQLQKLIEQRGLDMSENDRIKKREELSRQIFPQIKPKKKQEQKEDEQQKQLVNPKTKKIQQLQEQKQDQNLQEEIQQQDQEQKIQQQVDKERGKYVPLELIQKRRKKHVRIGSLPFGFPTQAVYKRTYRHIQVRDQYQISNQMLMNDLSQGQYQHIMIYARQ